MKKSIRLGQKEDASFILEMIKKLAIYEKAEDKVLVTLDQLVQDGFTSDTLFKTIILEAEEKPVGMALFYNRYSTWKGKSLYLEDLFVLPEYRGHGLGMLAMKWLAKFALDTHCKRFEWQVLDWNEPSIKFYKTINTELDSEWVNCRLEGEDLAKLGRAG